MKKTRLLVISLALAAGLAVAGVAGADPAFGPGNGTQNGDKCHPPGQTVDTPGCK